MLYISNSLIWVFCVSVEIESIISINKSAIWEVRSGMILNIDLANERADGVGGGKGQGKSWQGLIQFDFMSMKRELVGWLVFLEITKVRDGGERGV